MRDSNRSFAVDSSINRTAKRLPDPTLSNRAFAIFFIVTILIAITLLLAPKAQAASLYWDTSNSSGLQAGNGTWSTSVGNWNTSPTPAGSGRVNWTNPSDAFFNANGTSTVTVSGTVQVGSMTFNGTGYTIGGSTLTLTGSNITTNADATISAILGGSVGLTKLGGSTLILKGANNYTGETTLSAGTLQLSGSGTLGSTSGLLTVSAGTLDVNGTTQTVGALFGSGGTILNNGAAKTLTVGNGGQTGSYWGVIANGTGTLALTKAGVGTQTLNGNNTYTGATTINASGGTLEIANSNFSWSGRISGTSGVTVNSGGTLLLSGNSSWTDRINNSATMTLAGGTFNTGGLSEHGGTISAPTAGIGALTLTATSTIDFGPGNTSIIEFAGLGAHTPTSGPDLLITNWDGIPTTGNGTERLLFAGTATSFTTAFSQSDVSFNGGTGYTAVQFSGFYEITAIPEPSTWIGGALAVGILAWGQRRRFGRRCKRAG